MSDFADWQVPQAHADTIAATGVPLLAQPATVFANTAISLAAGTSQTFGSFVVNQTAYEIWVAVNFPAGATVPFVELALLWGEPANAVTIAADTYILPGATSTPGFVVRGRGPAKGSNVIVSLINLDAGQTATVQVRLIQHSRPVMRDLWKWNNQADKALTVPTWTLPALTDDETVLGMGSATSIAAAGNAAFLCGMHDGPIQVGLEVNSGAASNLIVQVAAEPGGSYVSNNPLYSVTNGAPSFQIAGTRSPLRFQLHNNGTTVMTVTWSMLRVLTV